MTSSRQVAAPLVQRGTQFYPIHVAPMSEFGEGAQLRRVAFLLNDLSSLALSFLLLSHISIYLVYFRLFVASLLHALLARPFPRTEG